MVIIVMIFLLVAVGVISYKIGVSKSVSKIEDTNLVRVLSLIMEEVEDTGVCKFGRKNKEKTDYENGFISCADNLKSIVDNKILQIIEG